MRSFFLSICMILCMGGFAQTESLPGFTDSVAKMRQSLDSTTKILQDLEQGRWTEKSTFDVDQNMKGLNYLLEQQKERRAKEKRAAFIRIGIGVLFLAVLIIGLMRRRTRKESTN